MSASTIMFTQYKANETFTAYLYCENTYSLITKSEISHNSIAGDNTTCHALGPLVSKASAYLFPFVLEYSLSVVGILIGFLNNLDIKLSRDIIDKVKASLKQQKYRQPPRKQNDDGFDKSHMGLFFGAISFSSVVVVTVVIFAMKGEGKSFEVNLAYYIYDIINYSIMFAGCVIVFIRIRAFMESQVDVDSIDHVLLMLGLSGVFLIKFFKLFSNAHYFINGGTNANSVLDLVCCVLTICTVLCQTVLIMDGLHIHCKREKELANKPGRGTIAFLVILNISIWLFKTINIKQLTRTVHENTFGNVAWPLIFNGFVPIMLFYHFHASVMLADIWSEAYDTNSVVSLHQ